MSALENEYLKHVAAEADRQLDEVKDDLMQQIGELREELQILNKRRPMSITEYMLVCIEEECGEIVQAASKAQRFGLDDRWSSTTENRDNREQLVLELTDLFATVQLAQEMGLDLTGLCDADKVKAKTEKLKRMIEYSKARGTIEDEA